MRSYLLPEGFQGSGRLEIAGDDYHYLSHVLRCRPGDRFPAVDGRGGCFVMAVEEIGPDRMTVGVRPAGPGAPGPGPGTPELHLLQCLPKGSKMDQIVRQSTEAGVRRIVPLFSRHAVPRPQEPEESTRKLARWRRIAREALQQCGGPVLPEIEAPVALADFVKREALPETRIFFHSDLPESRPGAEHSLHALLAGAQGAVFLLVGPEGGLAAEEVGLLLEKGFSPVHVPGTVLRSETAALFALAAAQIILKERHWWRLAC